MKLLSRILTFFITLIALVFALSNRAPISISLWPFDLAIEAPLGLIALGGLLIGMFMGAFVVWISVLPHHFMSKRLRREIRVLQTQLNDVRKSVMPDKPSYDLSFLPRPKPRWQFWRHDL